MANVFIVPVELLGVPSRVAGSLTNAVKEKRHIKHLKQM